MRLTTTVIFFGSFCLGNSFMQKQVSNSFQENQPDSTVFKRIVSWLDMQKSNLRDSASKTAISRQTFSNEIYGSKNGFIDLTGNEVIPLIFDYVIGFYEFRFNSNGIVGVAYYYYLNLS